MPRDDSFNLTCDTRIGATKILITRILVWCATSIAAVAGPISVTGGQIAGTTEDGIRVYKGVPFAAPPVGELRWKEPQLIVAWQGVRDCTKFGPSCPQSAYAQGSLYYRELGEMSEDCLFLNVWTAAKDGDKLPVMVWIHGGALTRGSGDVDAYNGANLARKGVVLVTINYRLGAFGYFAHPALSAESPNKSSGNYGHLDQVAALKWVKDNIAKFGGDPNLVTIFGESAGSWGVCQLQASPLSKGLFHRAIGQSGGVFGIMPYLAKEHLGQDSAESRGVGFATALAGENASLDAMRAKSSDEVLKAFEAYRGGQWRPNVDGYAFPDEIYTIFKEGRQHDVPVIVGSNADEGTSLVPTTPQAKEAYEAGVKRQYGDLADEFLKLYPTATDADARGAFHAGFRDSVFTWQMRTWARMMDTVDSPAYLYFFSHVPPRPDKERYGAYHAAEIMYAFDNLHVATFPLGEADKHVAQTMSDFWVRFAKTGNPAYSGMPKWMPYDAKNEFYLEIGDTINQKTHLMKDVCDFFDAFNASQRAGGDTD